MPSYMVEDEIDLVLCLLAIVLLCLFALALAFLLPNRVLLCMNVLVHQEFGPVLSILMKI